MFVMLLVPLMIAGSLVSLILLGRNKGISTHNALSEEDRPAVEQVQDSTGPDAYKAAVLVIAGAFLFSIFI